MTLLCRVMRVSRSSYYQHLRQQQRPSCSQQRKLESLAKSIHEASKESYGSRRISESFQAKGYPVGRYQARSLMRKLNLVVKSTKRFKVTTDSNHNHPVAPNLLNRQFQVDRPDTVWASDITYLWTRQGWLYVAVVLDLFSRKVVGWSIDQRPTTAMVNSALGMAVAARRPSAGTTLHSDHGPQYTAWAFSQKIRAEGLVHSLGTVGDAFDNAMVESFWGRMQTELLDRQKWSTRVELSTAMFDWIEAFYNPTRRHSALGNISPAEFERRHANTTTAA